MNVETILAMTCVNLKEELRKLNLQTTGKKDELRNRLLAHHNLSQIDESEDESTDFADPNGENAWAVGNVTHFSLKDVEDSLTTFSGTDSLLIDDWIKEFQEAAMTIGWNELQCFIFGKQLLKGAAKQFLKSQSGITSWRKLKDVLYTEFHTTISAAEIHKMLKNRRKRDNETLIEYLYSLMEIAKNIQLDDESIVSYFVEGVPDSKQNKLILYQAKNVKNLKEAIKVYEKVRDPRQPLNKMNTHSEQKQKREVKNEQKKHCFNCGEDTHFVKNCPKDNTKCFKCNQWGHRSFECTASTTTQKQQNEKKYTKPNVNMMSGEKSKTPQLIFKPVMVENFIMDALIDTGCVVSLLRYDGLMRLDDRIMLDDTKIQLVGIGEYEITTMGCFETLVRADGVVFSTIFHVVSERDLKYTMIIGRSALNEVDLLVTNGEAKFINKNRKYSEAVDREENLKVTVKIGKGEEEKIKVDKKKVEVEERKEVINQKKYDIQHEFKTMCNIINIENSGEIELTHLNEKHAEEISRMIEEYSPKKKMEPPITMKILLEDDIPVVQRPRRISYADKQIVETQIEKWLNDGIIQASNSQYAAPIVLVPKKDGSTRLCCDYRMLNKKMVKDNFPMALMDDVIERLQRGKVFTTLDLENGFFHVPMDAESRKYTAFVTHNGQYEYLFAPFGLTNSPAVFNRYITIIFRKLIENGTVVVYMDDIIIPAKDADEGLQKLKEVLQLAERYGLKIKWRKCQFLKEKIEFLGYIVENGTIKPSEGKTIAIKNYPLPVNEKALQRFMGLMSYFRRFIFDFAIIAKPLSDLLKKEVKYELKDEQIAAFKQLKSALIQAPVLKLFDPVAETEIHTDASKYGYGAVLFQRDMDDNQLHPVQFMSRKTSNYEEKYSSYELEVLAVVQALKKWRIYVLGKSFKIITDCNAFAMTLNKAELPVRVSRWVMYLQDFNYVVEHRTGTKMKHVDALSRVSCLLMEESLKHRLKQAQMLDDWIKAVTKVLEKDEYEDFYLFQGILHKDPNKELIVVPAAMEDEIMKIAHRAGHFSAKKTQEHVEKSFYIPNLQKKANNVVKSCIECIITNAKAGKPEGLITTIGKDDRPFITYHIDHVGPMEETSKAYNYILVIIDAFSKFTWLYPTKNTGSETVVEKLSKQAAIFGNPSRIISDRGTAFTANIFKQYCQKQGVQHLLITTGVPRGNGQVERVHKVVIPMLAKLCHEAPKLWYKHVDKVQQILNSTAPRSTKRSPFEIITGVKMKTNLAPDLQNMLHEELLQEYEDERKAVREEARDNIQIIQAENRRSANQNRQEAPTYDINDLVAVKRTQYGTGLRLRPKYFGPYKVIARRGHDRYEVEKVGQHEGPRLTSTVAENMKRWH